jgi:CubicO group peptidase (beta-lactamase class C family)
LHRAVCLAVLIGCGGSNVPAKPVQPVVTGSKPAEPAKPAPPPVDALTAQKAFELWLAPWNAADAAGLAGYAKYLSPDMAKDFDVDAELGFRDLTGGLDVRTTEEATPKRFVAIVKERDSDVHARAIVELDASNLVRTFDVVMVPTPAELRPARLSEADAITALRARLDALVAQDKFSGAVLVARNGKVVFAQAYGMADRDKAIPNTLDTRFRIGSMNKMFTATAILQLVQAKKISLDDTVGKLLPDYPNKDVAAKVTIHHLLTHTGGTGDIFGPDYDVHRLELRTLDDYVKLYGARALEFEPGTEDRYSNYGFLLLGVIVEKVTKKSYYDAVEASIFKRAKMTSTSSPFEDKPMAGRSIAYSKNLGDQRLAAWTDAKDTLPIRATSAGGGDSTVGDLLKFANALTAHGLLDKKHTELMTTRKTGEAAGGYGFGFGTFEEDGMHCFGHGGGAPGMNGDLEICSSGYTVAVLANLDPPAAQRIRSFILLRLPTK